MPTRRASLALLSICAGALIGAPPAFAQTYPAKLVRIINPVAPGGNQETVARAIGDHIGRELGQPFIVESRPGSAATIGTRYVKAAAPDGYTLLAISNTFVRVPALVSDAGYDPLKDFSAVSLTCDVPLVLVVNPALPVKSVRELIALAKTKPGEITSASSGVGSTGHVAAEVFARRAGIRFLHVQYKGAAPAVVDLVGGHVMLRFDQVTTSLALIRSGKLRALGVTSRQRSSVLPDVPTMDEAGVRGFVDTTWNGLVAPAGTPRGVVDRLREAIGKAVNVTELHSRFAEQGIDLVASGSTEEFAAFLRKELEGFARVAREVGMAAK